MTLPPEPDGPPSERPGPPAGAVRGPDDRARWPWWFVLAGPAVVLFLQQVIGIILAVALLARGADLKNPPPGATLGLGFGLSASLIGTAVAFPFVVSRPRLRDFGLTRTRVWPAIGWSVLAMASFLAFATLYQRILGEDVTQSTLDELGVGRSLSTLVVGGLLIVVAAPIGEELFFRGFLYRALRSRLGVPAAVLIAGGIFGLPHLPTGVTAVPPLALLGMAFCLVYERTGSIFPTIALHSLNNAFAYSLSPEAPAGSWRVALPLIVLMLGACLVLPRLLDTRSARSPEAPVPAPG